MHNLIKLILTSILYVVINTSVSANVVFENGIDGTFVAGNNPQTYRTVTNSFSLANGISFNSFTYNAFTYDYVPSPSWADISIYNASDTGLTNAVFSQHASLTQRATIGTFDNYNLDDFTFNLNAAILAAGNYFLALQVENVGWDNHWSINNWNGDTSPLTDGIDHYFRLENSNTVPEPTSIVLLATGLLSFGASRRKNAQA